MLPSVRPDQQMRPSPPYLLAPPTAAVPYDAIFRICSYWERRFCLSTGVSILERYSNLTREDRLLFGLSQQLPNYMILLHSIYPRPCLFYRYFLKKGNRRVCGRVLLGLNGGDLFRVLVHLLGMSRFFRLDCST